MKTILFSVGLAIALMMEVQGQGQLNIAFRPSSDFPVKDLGSTELKKGNGFDVKISYRFFPRLAAYAGWGLNIFKPMESANNTEQFVETGYRFGFQFIRPISSQSKLNILLGAGGIANHIGTENNNGDIVYDTEHDLGYEVELGLAIPLDDDWRIVPGLRYHALPTDVMNDGIKKSADLNYVSLGVSVMWIHWNKN